MAQRKSVRDLSATEQQQFIAAVKLLKQEVTGTDGLST